MPPLPNIWVPSEHTPEENRAYYMGLRGAYMCVNGAILLGYTLRELRELLKVGEDDLRAHAGDPDVLPPKMGHG